jgi:hypothetical protein
VFNYVKCIYSCCAIYSELSWLNATCCEHNDAFKYLFMWLKFCVRHLVFFVHNIVVVIMFLNSIYSYMSFNVILCVISTYRFDINNFNLVVLASDMT